MNTVTSSGCRRAWDVNVLERFNPGFQHIVRDVTFGPVCLAIYRISKAVSAALEFLVSALSDPTAAPLGVVADLLEELGEFMPIAEQAPSRHLRNYLKHPDSCYVFTHGTAELANQSHWISAEPIPVLWLAGLAQRALQDIQELVEHVAFSGMQPSAPAPRSVEGPPTAADTLLGLPRADANAAGACLHAAATPGALPKAPTLLSALPPSLRALAGSPGALELVSLGGTALGVRSHTPQSWSLSLTQVLRAYTNLAHSHYMGEAAQLQELAGYITRMWDTFPPMRLLQLEFEMRQLHEEDPSNSLSEPSSELVHRFLLAPMAQEPGFQRGARPERTPRPASQGYGHAGRAPMAREPATPDKRKAPFTRDRCRRFVLGKEHDGSGCGNRHHDCNVCGKDRPTGVCTHTSEERDPDNVSGWRGRL